MNTDEFFDEQLPGSKIKSKIVSSYFWKWSKVMISQVKTRGKKIGYIDFFSGQGKYEDGSDSAPIIIIEMALSNQYLRKMLVTVFNDKSISNITKLEEEINNIKGTLDLKHQPTFLNYTVGKEVVEQFKKIELIPSLIFIDPYGYKGLSLDLIASTIKDWGCDCIFFFNYNRINAALNNPAFKSNVDDLFSKETADSLREKVKGLNPKKREELVLNTFGDSLKKIKGEYFIWFKFYKNDSKKTSHFLFFVAKHALAYHLMKETMAENCEKKGGVPTYEYKSSSKNPKELQLFLFSDEDSEIKKLAEELYQLYKGKITSRKKIYEEHNIGKPYIANNYKDALLILENSNRINITPPLNERQKRQGKPTLGEELIIKF